MIVNKKDRYKDYLFEAILSLETVDECYDFFDDLLTIRETNEMVKRMRAAYMLSKSKIYSEITEVTGLSTATISRINRCLKYGSGGYSTILDKLEAKNIILSEEDV